jgi:hypothetical protein
MSKKSESSKSKSSQYPKQVYSKKGDLYEIMSESEEEAPKKKPLKHVSKFDESSSEGKEFCDKYIIIKKTKRELRRPKYQRDLPKTLRAKKSCPRKRRLPRST